MNAPRKLVANPKGRLFRSCSQSRVAKIQEFIDVVAEHCGVRYFDEKESQTTSLIQKEQ